LAMRLETPDKIRIDGLIAHEFESVAAFENV
jgi:hypothetical protein